MLNAPARVLCLLAAAAAGEPPEGAVPVGGDDGSYVCRAHFPDGTHPGMTAPGGFCLVPSRGGVIRRTDFEYVALKAAQWSTASGEGREPAPVGMQHGKYPLSSCRIRTAAGRYVAGKLYLAGAHAGHCYVPLDGREEDYTSGFETLTLPR